MYAWLPDRELGSIISKLSSNVSFNPKQKNFVRKNY